MKRRWGMALVVVAAWLPVGPAHGAGWRAQEVLVPDGSVESYDLAIAPSDGESVHVWRRAGDQIEALVRPLGGGGARQLLELSTGDVTRVAMAAGGRATAVHTAGGNVRITRRGPGEAFGLPAGATGTAPDVVSLTDGTTWIAWIEGGHIEVRKSPGGAAAFAPEPDITPPEGTPRDVRLWPGRNGELLLTYVGRITVNQVGPIFNTTDRLRAAIKLSGDTALSGDQGVLHELVWPHIGNSPPEIAGIEVGGAAFAGGVATVALSDLESLEQNADAGVTHVVAVSRSLAPAGTWAAQEVDSGDYTLGSGDLASSPAIAPLGDAGTILLWAYNEADDDGAGTQIRVARRDGSGAFTTKPALADRGEDDRQVFGPSVAPLPEGRAIALFSDVGSPTPLRAGSILLGPGDERREVLTDAMGGDSDVPKGNDFRFPLVTSPDGHALAATAPGNDTLQVHRLDTTPPQLAVSVPARVNEDTATALSATATDDLGTPNVRWDLGDGRTAEGLSATVTWPQPGVYTVTAIADDGAANETRATAVITVDAVRAFPPPLPPPGGPPTALDRTAPRVTGFGLSWSRFAVGSQPTALAAQRRRTPRGTTISFRINEPARVALAVQRRSLGYRSGRRCVTRRPRRTRRVRRCTRYVTRGTIRRTVRAGANDIAFSGRLGRRALPVGRYRIGLVATDAARNVSRVQRRAFRIVRR